MRRLIAAGLLPERAGQPVKAWVHISLADLMLLDADSALQDQWTAQVRRQWAARRAFASETGSEGGAWLDGDAAGAVACDAAMAPSSPVTSTSTPWRTWSGCASNWTPGGGGRGTRPGLRSSRPSSARPSTSSRVPAGWRASCAAAAGGPPRRSQPAAGHRVQRERPGGDPQRGRAAGQALPVGRRVQPACLGLRGAPHQAQEERRPDVRHRLRASALVPPPDRHPPLGLDPGPEPRRHHHRLEQDRTKTLHSHGPPVRPG